MVISCSSDDQTTCGGDLSAYQSDHVVTIIGVNTVDVFRRLADGSIVVADENSATSIDELELHVELSYTKVPRTADSVQLGFPDWLVGAAHACSVPLNPGDIESNVVDIDLMSNVSLGAVFEAGRSLSSAFYIQGQKVAGISYADSYEYDESYGGSQLPMQEFARDQSVVADVKYRITPKDINQLSSIGEQLHQFTFSISLETGEMFTAMSNAVQLSD